MSYRINLATPHISEEGYELEYINDAFSKNWVAPLGENVNKFEKAICAYTGAEHAVALSAGTAALHLSMILAGVGRGDTVFCQDLTFAASANPIAYVGARPVFIDSEKDTWNMDPVALEKAITLHGVPKAVVIVHLYGNPAKIHEICEICDHYGITLIEDSAESLGSSYQGKPCGTFGKYGILSFNGNKIITTSGGGMLLCKEEEDAKHALKLATQAREDCPYYLHTEIGFNYRMSNISAGIGCGQLKVLQKRIEKKRAIYKAYQSALSSLPLTFQPLREEAPSNCWLTSMTIDEHSGVTPTDVINALGEKDIEARHFWNPMHRQPIFAKEAFVSLSDKSIATSLFTRGVCLPSDTKMTDEDVDCVCNAIKTLF
jgi:dTDP-4-amino-4,6-dideoxygalactose transaminase